MWITDSIWFEIAVVSVIFAIGSMIFGHFEEQTPKIRRVGKYLLTLLIIIGLSINFGKVVALTALGLLFLPVVYIHVIVLPKNGVNGLTGEPKDRYYEIRGWDKNKLYRKKSTDNIE